MAGAGLRARLRALPLWSWFVLLAAPVGLFVIVVVPPSQGLDEPAHFFRAYAISKGHLVASTRVGRVGTELPDCVTRYVKDIAVQAKAQRPMRPATFRRTPSICHQREPAFQPFENSALNSPVAYAPQLVGVTVMRLAGAPPPVVFYAGRVTGLIGYLILVALALRVAPRGTRPLFVIGTFPISVFLAGTYSADSVLIGLSLLAVALTLRCRFDPDASWRTFLQLAVVLVAAASVKQSYFVLGLLCLLVPQRLFRSRQQWWLAMGAVLGAVLLVGGIWYLQVRDVTVAPYFAPGTIDKDAQFSHVFSHPFSFVAVVVRSLFHATPESYFVPGFVASFGHFRAAGSPLAPVLVTIVGCCALFESLRSEAGPRRQLEPAGHALAAAPIGIVVLGIVLLEGALYVGATKVGAPLITQAQGRYFLPYAALAVLSVCLWRERPPARSVLTYVAVAGALLYWMMLKIPSQYY